MWLTSVYLPDFPAWSLARYHGRPGIVFVHERGEIISMSTGGTDRGVGTGDTLDRAKSLAPDGLFYNRDRQIEAVMEEELLRSLYQLTPRLQPDRVTNSTGLWVALDDVEEALLREWAQGHRIRIGTGMQRPYAMLAATQAGFGEITTVSFRDTPAFLRRCPVTAVEAIGFDTRMIERLQLFGIRTIWALERLTRRHLFSQFGREGERLFWFLHPEKGNGAVPYYEWNLIERVHDFDWPIREPGEAMKVVPMLLEELTQALDGKWATRLEWTVRDAGRKRTTSRILKEATANTGTLERVCAVLASEVMTGQEISGLAITLGGLTPAPVIQTELFFRRTGIERVIEAMKRQFPGQLVRAVIVHPDAFFPEDEARLDPILSTGLKGRLV